MENCHLTYKLLLKKLSQLLYSIYQGSFARMQTNQMGNADIDSEGQEYNEHGHGKQDGQSREHQIKQLHGTVMIVSWFALLQLAIWAHYFKSYRYSILVHILCVCLICAFSIIGATVMLVYQGSQVITQSFLHQTLGFLIIAAILPIAILLGLTTLITRYHSGFSPIKLQKLKNVHSLFGWMIIILIKLPLLTGLAYDEKSTAAIVGIIDVGLFLLYRHLKQNRQRIQNIMMKQVTIQSIIQSPIQMHDICRSFKEYTQKYNNLCFIFGNGIYPIQNVITSHPGGSTLIQNVRNREIDRFIYGIQIVQKFYGSGFQPHSHSANFLHLSVATCSRISISEPYIQLNGIKTNFTVAELYKNQSSNMFVVYCRLEEPVDLGNSGYTSVTQLGRHRAVLLNGITRLYSNVQFLRLENVKFMSRIMGTPITSYVRKKISGDKKVEINNNIQLEQKFIEQKSESFIHPLLIKSYPQGRLTQFLQQNLAHTSINNPSCISRSHGFGLGLYIDEKIKLDENFLVSRQKIVIFAGGTGLNPFCDLIDLLFKKQVIKRGYEDTKTLINQNFILLKEELRYFSFIFYIGVNSLSHIHPITLFQLEFLAKNNALPIYIKSKQALPQSAPLSSLQYVNKLPIYYRFQTAIQKQLSDSQKTKFLLCGPAQLVKSIVGKLQYFRVSPSKYRIV